MVLEHLFPDNWLEKKVRYSFLLGAGYSIIGIILARLLFGANSGLASVIFTSLLLIPSMRKLFVSEEKVEEHEKRFSIKHLYNDNKHLIKAYVGIFIGVYVAYYLVSFIGMYFGFNTINILREQLFLEPAISGRATYDVAMFWSILSNNWWVLAACFFLSLISGDGAIFFIVWNASAWAAIFGFRAVAAAAVLGKNAVVVGLTMEVISLPHTLFEGGAYILAGIAGAVISNEVIKRSKDLKIFLTYFFFAVIGFYFLNWFFKIFAYGWFLTVLKIGSFMGIFYLLKNSFTDKKHKEVFSYNYYLFALALLLFIIGALIETGVLSFSHTLNLYYAASMNFLL